MSIYDDAAKAAAEVAPTPSRTVCIGTLVNATMVDKGNGLTSFTLWVDYGSGPVPASSTDTLLAKVYALPDATILFGRSVLVQFIQGSPFLIDLVGYIAIQVL